MRVKTDLRRSAIVETAWEVFKQQGYERASMSEIAARMGGSKATLYRYFPSKDLLFLAAVKAAVKAWVGPVFQPLVAAGDLAATLGRFARDYLRLRISPEMMALERLLIAEAERSPLGGLLRTHVIETEFEPLADLLAQAIARGDLRTCDPRRAAMHLKALVETDLHERMLHGSITEAGEAEIELEAEDGVAAFLRAYAPSR